MNEKELMEKRNDLITRSEEILAKAKSGCRELTDDEMQELAEIRDDVRRIMKELGIKKDLAELDKGEAMANEEKVDDAEEKETRAFEDYIRGIVNERANNLIKSDGQALIPTTIANRIIKKVYDVCPILEKSTKYNVKGTLTIPSYDESETAITVAYQTEFNAVQSNVGKFTNITLTGYLAGALSLISRSLINNSQFDVVGFVVDEMAYHIARFIELQLLVGNSSYVKGLSTLTNSLTSASASAITADELIRLQGKVKDVYQGPAIWIMSPNTRDAIRTLKSTTGSYLLNNVYDIKSPFGYELLGKPVYVSDNMPDIGSGNTAIYYGDMSGLATKFSEEINIQVLREKYADQHAIGVIGWFEFDSKVENNQKIAKLVCGTTSA